MAEKSLSLDELVRKLMGDEHADVLRETLAWFVGELMEAEVAEQIGAVRHEKSAERVTHRNGYRERTWQTRAGELELAGHLTVPANARGVVLFAHGSGSSRDCLDAGLVGAWR